MIVLKKSSKVRILFHKMILDIIQAKPKVNSILLI